IPLGLGCAGIIAETGGLMSPGASACREFGLVAAFGVENAGLLLEDGEWVRVDGRLGTVQRLDIRADESPISIRPHSQRLRTPMPSVS
ncbi:MAG: PEP-utilizing enzyme, partial [Myxococcota bacterium]